METVWFAIAAGMLATYAVLDGFDLGVGILHRGVARTDQERRIVLAAIGPVWDGNEVWLIAAGGTLFMAFPRAYSTAFSGFYLALMIVLWLLILRGVAIEFRSHQENPLWREFWDTVFSFASILLAIVFGASLGNLVRGVPLGNDGLAGMDLFTNFRTGKEPGIFDWYTTLVGIFALIALAGHGALFLVWRTTGPVSRAKFSLCTQGVVDRAAVLGRRHPLHGVGSASSLHQFDRSSLVHPLRRPRDGGLRSGLLFPQERSRAGGLSLVFRISFRPAGRNDDRKLSILATIDH